MVDFFQRHISLKIIPLHKAKSPFATAVRCAQNAWAKTAPTKKSSAVNTKQWSSGTNGAWQVRARS
jgi:hypothetical protein